VRTRSGGALASPYLAGLTLLVALPAAAALFLAFTDYSGLAAPRFVGFDNFTRLVGDQAFWRALGNTGIYALISIPVRVVAAVGLALLLFRRGRGVGAARAAAFLPTVVPDAAFALLWLWLLNPLFGPLIAIVDAIGFGRPAPLADPWGARFAVALMGAFQVGEGFVIALAARRMIPNRLFEAAKLDGASSWFVTTRITLPLMAPVLALLALRDLVLSFQINFVPAFLLTEGGPRYATTFMPLYVYRQAFRYFRLGYASAMAVTLFVLTALVVYAQYRLAKRWRMT
jgi:multiple sugar transport system permease protein